MNRIQRTILYFVPVMATGIILATSFTNSRAQDQPQKDLRVTQAQPQPASYVAIRVPNLEQTEQWYAQNLGFKEVQRFSSPDLPGIDFAFIERNGFRIDVIGNGVPQRLSPLPANAEDFKKQLIDVQGYNHVGIRVADVDATVAAMRSRGVKIIIEPEDVPIIRTRLAHVQDNSGNDVELVQPLRETW